MSIWDWDLLTWVCVTAWALLVALAIAGVIHDQGKGTRR